MTPTPNEIYERLGGIDQKLDQLLEQRTDHEGRIRSLERWKWILLVIAAAGDRLWSVALSRV
jgi:hypothetical protein